jgi:hypothetical protein
VEPRDTLLTLRGPWTPDRHLKYAPGSSHMEATRVLFKEARVSFGGDHNCSLIEHLAISLQVLNEPLLSDLGFGDSLSFLLEGVRGLGVDGFGAVEIWGPVLSFIALPFSASEN